MSELRYEYTDIKNIVHKVEHLTLENNSDKEQIINELLSILTKTK